MRWRYIARNWAAFQPALLDAWPQLDPDSLFDLDGDREAVESALVALTGQNPDEVATQVDEWLEGAVPADIHMDAHLDNAAISESRRYVSPGEDASDDDARFGDDAVAPAP